MIDPFRVLTDAEDTARRVRNKARAGSFSDADAYHLANAVVQALQTIREHLQQ